MIKEKNFLNCESKFILFLILGIVILNILGLIFQYLFNIALFISIGMSVIVLMAYILYFVFGIIKYVIFEKDYDCIDIRRRVASWLSSLV